MWIAASHGMQPVSETAPVAGIILAAGQASRFRAGDPSAKSKTVALLEGTPLVRRVAEAALAAGLSPVVVVTGFGADDVADAVQSLPVRLLHNPDYETGLASSLRAGVAALDDACAGAAILLADMPRVTPGLIQTLVDAWRARPEAAAAAPTWSGQRGNPVILGKRLFADVARLTGDVGARPLLTGRSDVLDVAVDDVAVALDVDTPEALLDLSR